MLEIALATLAIAYVLIALFVAREDWIMRNSRAKAWSSFRRHKHLRRWQSCFVGATWLLICVLAIVEAVLSTVVETLNDFGEWLLPD